jgi:hypothetical protein
VLRHTEVGDTAEVSFALSESLFKRCIEGRISVAERDLLRLQARPSRRKLHARREARRAPVKIEDVRPESAAAQLRHFCRHPATQQRAGFAAFRGSQAPAL